MGESESETPLEEIVGEAEEQRERFNEARSRLQQVRERLRNLVGEMVSEGTIGPDEGDRIHAMIDEGEYGRARDAIRDAREGALEFDDEEKDAFARRFSESWEEMEGAAEAVATAALDLERDIDREDMISLIYGKHSSLNKGEIRAVFEAFDSLPEGGLSDKQLARLLQAFNSDLNIRPTVDVLGYIKEEANR